MELGLNVRSGSPPWEAYLCSTNCTTLPGKRKGLLSFKKKELPICKIISLMLVSVVIDCPFAPFGMEYVLFVNLFSEDSIIFI